MAGLCRKLHQKKGRVVGFFYGNVRQKLLTTATAFGVPPAPQLFALLEKAVAWLATPPVLEAVDVVLAMANAVCGAIEDSAVPIARTIPTIPKVLVSVFIVHHFRGQII